MPPVAAATSTRAPASFEAAIALAIDHVARRVESHVRSPVAPAQQLADHAAHYRGKMVRPTLTILSALAADASHPDPRHIDAAHIPDAVIAVAAVVEMIHLATLVHDDVLDEADVRRGSPTICALAGNEAAVMLGDLLFARAYHLCSTLDDQHIALRVAEVTTSVCEGEILQLANRGNWSLTERTYSEIIERKTGALIAVGCELGARVIGGTPEVCAALARFGTLLGRAFQIQDDLLDLTGSRDAVGKPVGRDAEKGKPTLALIHLLASLPARDREAVIAEIERDGTTPAIRARLEAAGSIAYARAAALSLAAEARAELSALPESPARDRLAALATAAVERKR